MYNNVLQSDWQIIKLIAIKVRWISKLHIFTWLAIQALGSLLFDLYTINTFHVFFSVRWYTVNKMAAIPRSLRIFPASCTRLTRQLFPKPNHRNKLSQARSTCLHYSTDKRSVPPITNVNGETIVRSPYADLSIPQCSFAEYVFEQLDNFSDFALMVCKVFSSQVYNGKWMGF